MLHGVNMFNVARPHIVFALLLRETFAVGNKVDVYVEEKMDWFKGEVKNILYDDVTVVYENSMKTKNTIHQFTA